MTEQVKPLDELIKELSPSLQAEVRDFVEFLLEKQMRRRSGKPNFEWEGALKGIDSRLTSVDLQHKIADWRAEQP